MVNKRFDGAIYGGINTSPWYQTLVRHGNTSRLINDDNLAIIEGVGRSNYETYLLYADLLTDADVGAGLDIISSEITSRELVVEPILKTKRDIMCAEFIKDIYTHMPFYAKDEAKNPNKIDEKNPLENVAIQQQQTNGLDGWTRFLVNGTFIGAAPSEWMVRKDGGYIVPERIEARDIRRYQYDVDEQGLIYPKLMKDFNTYEGEFLPPRKFVVFNYKFHPNENPNGLGLGRRCFYPVAYKRELATLMLAGAGKFAIPTIKYTFPEDMKLEDRDILYDDVVEMRENSVFGAQEGVNLEFMSAQMSGAGEYVEKVMNMYRNQVGMAILTVPFDKLYDNYKDLEPRVIKRSQAISKEIDSVVNATFVKWLVEYNFPDVKYPPKVYRRFTDNTELEEFITNVLNLHAVGYVVDREYIESVTGYPAQKQRDMGVVDAAAEIEEMKKAEQTGTFTTEETNSEDTENDAQESGGKSGEPTGGTEPQTN